LVAVFFIKEEKRGNCLPRVRTRTAEYVVSLRTTTSHVQQYL